MSDRELLEAAAKAAGYCVIEPRGHALLLADPPVLWNPLTDSGDAFELAVKLDMVIDCCNWLARPRKQGLEWVDGGCDDPLAATRRAIVRAAAEIGRSMK